MAFGLSAGAVTAIGLGAGALLGGSSQSGSATSTTQQQLDPRIGNIVFGDGTDANKGLLAQYQALGQTPQNASMSQYGQQTQDWLGQNGLGMTSDMHNAANNLMGGNVLTPTSQAASMSQNSMSMPTAMQGAQTGAATVNAPSQNNLNLSSAYNNMINGDAGANPYLTSALQSAVNQTNASYQQNQNSLTNNLMRTVLPGIGDAAQAAGGYGGTRQGIAEGNAISDYTNQLSNANLQLGLANSANTTGAQATSYNQGQDRSLAAMQGLSNQQYSTAQQEGGYQQQANLANQASTNLAGQTNYQGGLTQGTNNLSSANLAGQTNAGYQQQTNLANQNAQLANNQLNTSRETAGISANSGLLNNAYTVGGNQDAYALNKAGQTNGLLTPYLSANSSSTTSQPLYTNQLGNALGGATSALGLLNAYNKYSVSPGSSGTQSGYAFTGGD